MSSRHTVTGVRAGGPAHAARPGVPPRKARVIAAAVAAITAALWVGGRALLEAGDQAGTSPVSASQITVTPGTTAAARP